jgi:hypothetical protein
MGSVSYPIATCAEYALAKPLGFAERLSDAAKLVRRDVSFVSSDIGPGFENFEAASRHWYEHLIDQLNDRPWIRIREITKPVSADEAWTRFVRPICQNGRRWPNPPPPMPTEWRLNITFWRTKSCAL